MRPVGEQDAARRSRGPFSAVPAGALPARDGEKPTGNNRQARGVQLLGNELRTALIQERLRGLCEVDKIEQLSADQWRATCEKGNPFIIKVFPDGYLSITKS